MSTVKASRQTLALSSSTRLSSVYTIPDLVEKTGDSERTVQRRVAKWYRLQQLDLTLPRVTREQLPNESRWCFHVDAASYDGWLNGLNRQPGSETAKSRGCPCTIGLQGSVPVAILRKDCPVHKGLIVW